MMYLLRPQYRGHHVTGPTYLHLFVPIVLNFSLAQCPIDEPAETPGLEFPCRTIHPLFRRAFPDSPAWLPGFFSPLQCQQKQNLPFSVRRYGPPALFIALNCLGRSSQQLRHLRLSFAQPGSGVRKLVLIHKYPDVSALGFPPFPIHLPRWG